MNVWMDDKIPQDYSPKATVLNDLFHNAHAACDYGSLASTDKILNRSCERVMEIVL